MRIMKKNLIASGMITAMVILPVSWANAADTTYGQSTGSIHATGRVVQTPCDLDNPATTEVDLGQNISLTNLVANGHSPLKDVTIVLSNCTLTPNATITPNITTAVKSATVTFSGTRESGAGVNANLFANTATGAAAHVGVGMYTMSNTLIQATDQGQVFPLSASNANNVKLQFRIAAVHDDTTQTDVTPGNVESTINYTVSYQ